MLTIMKLTICCTLVLLVATTVVVSSPVDSDDGFNDKIDGTTASSVFDDDDEQMKVSQEDIAQFLRDMRKFSSQVPSSAPFKSTSGDITPMRTTEPSEASVESVQATFDVMVWLIMGVSAVGLIIILTITVVIVYVCYKNGKGRKKDFSLNKDLNRWDPQLLRPTKANLDAFIFGSPIPSVAEMIKN